MSVAAVRNQIENLLAFLEPELRFANCHMVDFLTQSLYAKYLPQSFQREIEEQGYKNSIKLLLQNDLGQLPFIKEFVRKGESLTLKNSSICYSSDEFFNKLNSLGCSNVDKLKLEIFMSSKKSHEVEILSAVAASLAKHSDVSHIVDIGDGKGYLSSMLSLHHKLPVLGVDSSQTNTWGAEKRANKLSRVWLGIKNRPLKSCPAKADVTQSSNVNLYKQITQYVTPEFNLENLVSEMFSVPAPLTLCITGLHTCGDLSPTSLKIFAANESVKLICNVGCCYHLLTEKSSGSDCDSEQHGFPMSRFLKEKHTQLGRHARMVANQSVERILNTKELPNKTIYFRALLQVLFEENCGELPTKHVGRFKKEAENFTEYARKAMKKVDVDFAVSDEDLEELDLRYQKSMDELNLFYLLRSKLAPIIESLILLDRLLFLLEMGFENSFVVQFFDPVISPRCYGLVALKNDF